ncbi:DNA primase [Arachidicoccus ginsenosidimutans]|uniref:DNA primase n=1 Tax=Arachidicoccus sp. BS20 TaxID=1850526 RepID=UPI0007F0E37C|nr:DNA primase [Arachidicoccus sp. BS20]ANI90735.1 DNA primase [Arachidicoccus sp. BS20]
MITPQTIEQITSRIDVVDVVGEFVKLKRRGANYLGLCPFHGEKTPSFTVSPTKEIFKCFGCGKSGSAITFLMEHEKYSYVEALRWLANRYGIEVEETEMSDEAKQHAQTADSLYIINGFAQKFFAQQLFETEEGRNIALTYLYERGFNDATLEKFGVGYSPDVRDAFSKAALQNQYNPELLLRTGLVRSYHDELQDNYRGRIIFPIHNNSGKVIGFGARVIGKKDNAPKYINTPENEIYVKSRILYGSYFARHSIDKNDECLLVEGYTDVVSLVQAGIENVVASGGTSLTTDQLRLIKKYTNNLTIIYDGDSAGVKAALRGLDMALEEGLNVRLVLIPDNEDPDSYVKKVGAAEFKKFVADNKKDFILFQLEIMLRDAGNDINKKSEVVNRVADSLSKISKAEDFTKQQEYIKQCAAILKIDEQGLTTLVNKYKRDSIAKLEKNQAFEEQKQEQETVDTSDIFTTSDDAQEKNILRVLLEYGLKNYDEERTIADYILEETASFPFDNNDYEQLFQLYETQYRQGLQPTGKSLLYEANEKNQSLIIGITMSKYELSQLWDERLGHTRKEQFILGRDYSVQDATMSVIYFKLRKIKRMFEQTQSELEQATAFDEQMRLLEVHKYLKAEEVSLTQQLGTVILK